jgi:SsrA-binding protein
MAEDIIKVIATNRKARHEYFVIHTYEAGIALYGTEVKSLRQGKINFVDSYAAIVNGEVWLHSINISEYTHGNISNHLPTRDRKLLLNKNEIKKLISKTQEKGLTLIPLSLYFKNGKVKVELGVCKGKKLYDKRAAIAEKDFKREQDRRTKY